MFRKISVFASLALLLAAIISVPAQASAVPAWVLSAVADDPKTGEDKPIVFRFKDPNGVNGGPGSPYYCITDPAPRPQLSRVPGGYTIHWGAKMNCTIQGTLDIVAELQQFVNGYPYTVQWAELNSVVGFHHIAYNIYQCVGFDPHGWRVKFYATWNGIPGEPLWGNSATYTLNCD